MSKETPIDDQKKWMISFISAIVFVIVSTPQTFKFTNDIFDKYFCIKTFVAEAVVINRILPIFL